MNTNEIQTRINAISDAMIAKAVPRPRAEFELRAHCEARVCLAWEAKDYINGYKFFDGAIEAILDEADAYVASLPSPEQARMTAFMTALAEAVELGKKNDIEVEFVNPLVALMKRLSKNALQYRATQEADAPRSETVTG